MFMNGNIRTPTRAQGRPIVIIVNVRVFRKRVSGFTRIVIITRRPTGLQAFAFHAVDENQFKDYRSDETRAKRALGDSIRTHYRYASRSGGAHDDITP